MSDSFSSSISANTFVCREGRIALMSYLLIQHRPVLFFYSPTIAKRDGGLTRLHNMRFSHLIKAH